MNSRIYYCLSFLILLQFVIQPLPVFAQYVAYYSAAVKNTENQPIENVLVISDGVIDSAVTDSDGKFLLKYSFLNYIVDSTTAYPLITCIHPNYQMYNNNIALSEGDSNSGPDIILIQKPGQEIVTISGKIVYENNEPIPGLYISFYNVNNYSGFSTSTNSDGNYTIQITAGTYYASASVYYNVGDTWTFRYRYYNNKPSLKEADLLVANDNLDNIDFIFPVLQLCAISGKIIDAETQQPLSHVWISVSSADQGDSTFTGTDENGDYSIQVFEGNYILFAYTEGYFQQFYDNVYNTFDATPVTVSRDVPSVSGIDFALTKPELGTNIISGTVRGKSTNTEIYGVSVYAIPLSGGNWVEAATGYDGNFILQNIKNGNYILLFYKENYISQFYKNDSETCNKWEDAYIFNLDGNEHIKNIVVFIEPTNQFGGEITGNIYTESGTTLSGTLITAVDSLNNVVSSSISVYNGNYSIPSLKNGNYTVRASKIGYTTSEYEEPVKIDLINNPVVNGVDFAIIATDAEEDENVVPEYFKLFQNYPNPFNPATNIQFSIPQQSFVTLKVYDILGREVETLVNEQKTAGKYEVNFNASYLSSGVYFYSIKAGDFIQTRKMVLMK
ncbi:MAG: carboxypeptidase regulatory-like domain-containing protein [Ignavibacteriaceae bacterium]